MNENQFVVYLVSRKEIRSGDISRFLAEFGISPDQPGRPRYAMGSVMFCVDGYDHSPEELYAIPEVRAYVRKVHAHWPCWLYYSELFSDCLRILAFCVIDSIEAVKIAGEPMARVSYIPEDIVRFLDQGRAPLVRLTLAAGWDDQVFSDRLQAVTDYFLNPE